MIKKVLVPTNGSESSRRALEFALELAKQSGSEIELLHVMYPIHAYWGYTVSYGFAICQMELETAGEAVLEATCLGLNFEDVKVIQTLKTGSPPKVILEEIEKGKFDLIVMGSNGNSRLCGFIFGSISQKVFKKAKTPVLFVR